jgi:hypothetical protein
MLLWKLALTSGGPATAVVTVKSSTNEPAAAVLLAEGLILGVGLIGALFPVRRLGVRRPDSTPTDRRPIRETSLAVG